MLTVECTEGQALTLPGGLQISFLHIPAGSFLLGQHSIRTYLKEYYLAIYPVTVEQYTCFVEDGGYHDFKYWTQVGWRWRKDFSVERPDDEALPEIFRNPSHPQIGVSWFEAIAFCSWLSHHSGQQVVLPNEMEWEKAARGIDGRKYPWGQVPATDIHCNFDSHMNHPTPVGMYPAGKSPFGCYDMAGNVWEWCRNTSGPLPYQDNEGRENLDYRDARVARGGAWNSGREELTCWADNMQFPNIRQNNLGFRIAIRESNKGTRG